MNREIIIDQIVDSYINSIYKAEAEVVLEEWIANVLMFGHKGKPFYEMDNDELLVAHRQWCEYLYEETK
jgi:hypothetical protein